MSFAISCNIWISDWSCILSFSYLACLWTFARHFMYSRRPCSPSHAKPTKLEGVLTWGHFVLWVHGCIEHQPKDQCLWLPHFSWMQIKTLGIDDQCICHFQWMAYILSPWQYAHHTSFWAIGWMSLKTAVAFNLHENEVAIISDSYSLKL